MLYDTIDRLKVIGDDVYYRGVVVAKIVIPESTVRDLLVNKIDNKRLVRKEAKDYA